MAHHDHDFFVPARSVWPPISCAGLGIMAFGFIGVLHASDFGVPPTLAQLTLLTGMGILIYAALKWFGQLVAESRARGFAEVPRVLDLANRYGMLYFIVSEVMFFAAFFVAYFYMQGLNEVWPPENIHPVEIGLPLINTLLLLTSGVTITWAHHALLGGNNKLAAKAVMATYGLGVVFLAFQLAEYGHNLFSINSGAYGSIFYMITGFHGFHVLLGSLMLMGVHYRLNKGDFSAKQHFYFEGVAWYWHFVDVVWVGLFLFVYLL